MCVHDMINFLFRLNCQSGVSYNNKHLLRATTVNYVNSTIVPLCLWDDEHLLPS